MNNLPDDVGRRLRDSLNRGTAPELSTDLVTGAAAHPAPKLANPRARIQVAGGATLLVVAVAAFALVIAPGLNTAPLFTAAASGANGKATGEAVPAANGLFRIWADYVYHAGDGLSTSGGSGDVYQLTRVGSPSDRAAALASVFGITGEATAVDSSDPANPLWTVGDIDGSAPSVQLTWSGTGDWWYSDPSADPTIACAPTDGSGGGGSSGSSSGSSGDSSDGSTSTNSDSGDGSDCTTDAPPPAHLAPTGADALSQAQALFARTGLNVSTDDIKIFGDSSQETATASLEVGGVQTALEWGVTWSDSGKIEQAYGSSITAVDRGSYGTVSATDAVDRLNDSRWFGTAGPKYSGGIRAFAMLGVGANGGVSTGSAPVPGSVSSAPSDDSTAAPSPTDAPTPVPTDAPTAAPTDVPTAEPTDVPTDTPTDIATPEPTPTGPPIINVTIKKAESTLVLMWDSKGDAWLVPGYAMQIENGWWDAVVALVPGVIQLPPVPTVEPDIAP